MCHAIYRASTPQSMEDASTLGEMHHQCESAAVALTNVIDDSVLPGLLRDIYHTSGPKKIRLLVKSDEKNNMDSVHGRVTTLKKNVTVFVGNYLKLVSKERSSHFKVQLLNAILNMPIDESLTEKIEKIRSDIETMEKTEATKNLLDMEKTEAAKNLLDMSREQRGLH